MRRVALCSVRAPGSESVIGVAQSSSIEKSILSCATDVVGGIVHSITGATNSIAKSGAETARATHFWSTVLAIWGRYKLTQTRAHVATLRGNAEAVKRLWEHRHVTEAEVRARSDTSAFIC